MEKYMPWTGKWYYFVQYIVLLSGVEYVKNNCDSSMNKYSYLSAITECIMAFVACRKVDGRIKAVFHLKLF